MIGQEPDKNAAERAALTARIEAVLPGASQYGGDGGPIEELRVYVEALEASGRKGLRGLHADWAESSASYAVLEFRAKQAALQR